MTATKKDPDRSEKSNPTRSLYIFFQDKVFCPLQAKVVCPLTFGVTGPIVLSSSGQFPLSSLPLSLQLAYDKNPPTLFGHFSFFFSGLCDGPVSVFVLFFCLQALCFRHFSVVGRLFQAVVGLRVMGCCRHKKRTSDRLVRAYTRFPICFSFRIKFFAPWTLNHFAPRHIAYLVNQLYVYVKQCARPLSTTIPLFKYIFIFLH